MLARPAYKNFQVQDKGRPMGGLAMIIPKNIRKHTTILKSLSWRIQPVVIKVGNKSNLIINSYFPTDPRTLGGQNIELENVLAQISNVIHSTSFNCLYLIGDINCNFIRNVKRVREFMNKTNLYSVWREFPIDFTHIYQKEDGICHVNTIDHFLTLENSKDNILDAGVLHMVQHQSDHEPIYMVVKCASDKLPSEEKYSENIQMQKTEMESS